MKIREFMLKAKVECSKYFDVIQLDFKHSVDFDCKSERVELTVFYDGFDVQRNFTVSVHCTQSNFNLEGLFDILKIELHSMNPDLIEDNSDRFEPIFRIN